MAAPVLAQQTGGIGGRPAHPRADNPRTQSIFVHELEHGETVEDAVLVNNGSDKERTIELYAVDGVVTNTGSYTCRQKAEAVQQSGGWIKLDKTEVTLRPGANEEIGFTITVPKGADVGEHNACLVFADVDDEGFETGGVRIQTRQAVRVVTTIPGDLHREITLAAFEATSSSFSVTAQNKGNVSADVQVSVWLKTAFGQVVQLEQGQYPVLANQSLALVFDRADTLFWGGWYRAQAGLAYNDVAGALGFDENAGKTERWSDEQWIFVMPARGALLVYGGIALLIIGLLVWWLVAGLRKRTRSRHLIKYVVKDGDTIESVAKAHGASWKAIARDNKLAAPYTLKPDQVLRVPRAKKKPQKRK